MSDQIGKLSCTLWSFALGGLVGALAVVMLVFFGGFGWNGAVFTGALLALAVGLFLAAVLCRPLPTMAEVQARAAVHAPKNAGSVDIAGRAAVTPVPMPAAAFAAVKASGAVQAATATKPAFLSAARDGRADDLKLIKGVGPKLEQMLHGMGVFHFDQIAGWTDAELAWVDDNLEGFKGRASRDGWVAQSRILAAGGSV
jgi:predicted flap endonuclease-1-like 5' DNA nuclease